MCPTQRLLDVPRAHPGKTNPRLVVPDGVAHGAVVVEGFIDDVPGIDFAGVVAHDSRDVVLQNRRELRRSVAS